MDTATKIDPRSFDFEALENAEVVERCYQRSPEWYAARRGRFTGSEISKLMTEPRLKADKDVGNLSDGAMTYVYQTLAESITGISKEAYSKEMQWGIEHEEEAKVVYSELFKEEISACDFVKYKDYGGGSPDGYIGYEGIAEIKCPYNSGNQIENLKLANAISKVGLVSKSFDAALFQSYHKEYYWQIQNNLMVTDRGFCRFISYDPRFAGLHRIACVTVPRVESDIQLILDKIEKASEVMVELKNALGL